MAQLFESAALGTVPTKIYSPSNARNSSAGAESELEAKATQRVPIQVVHGRPDYGFGRNLTQTHWSILIALAVSLASPVVSSIS